MSIKSFATLALAGLTVAKPVNMPQSLPHYKRNNFGAVSNGFGGNGFNFIDGFNNFNNQQQVIQIQEQNLQIVDNGFQQQVVQQVNEVLIVNQQQDGFNNDLNNLFRKSNFRNNNRDQATVIMVVQQIQVAVDDGRGNQFRQDVFAQSILVANRGARETQSIMVFDAKTLIAQDILGGGFNGVGGGFAGQSNGANFALPTKTNNVQLFGAKPTWSSIAEDPAATLGGVWQAELEDLQKAEQDNADNEINNQLAEQEKAALDAAQQEQANAEEQAAAAEEQAKADEEAKAAEGEQAAAEGEAAPAEEEQAAVEGEAAPAEGEAVKQE
ncbi:hypothetical protein K458DRAFT_418650 [Lentithecium fluviatile CBS 122367]|uniref:Uncharacterized protein n=1 Tax=Lentithecium fluviatile CBS 122367 TaxID=1168545 RepID=A0A6G1J0D7_9PLEO|nr:hypothetical protein K458DRAFT_418650 [Lentithecium fluviatile CBS 122367]